LPVAILFRNKERNWPMALTENAQVAIGFVAVEMIDQFH
jgi:hypothetical protein